MSISPICQSGASGTYGRSSAAVDVLVEHGRDHQSSAATTQRQNSVRHNANDGNFRSALTSSCEHIPDWWIHESVIIDRKRSIDKYIHRKRKSDSVFSFRWEMEHNCGKLLVYLHCVDRATEFLYFFNSKWFSGSTKEVLATQSSVLTAAEDKQTPVNKRPALLRTDSPQEPQ